MIKQEEIDYKDTNVGAIGTKEDRDVKKKAAETEPAWIGSGQNVGLEIWRINKFKVERWPKEDNGKFFNGDSYILLNTFKDVDTDELHYDLHFWIGQESTQDEYGTAAYKTVELDTYHDDKPIQHREVEGYESSLFKSYFKELTIMKGGVETGFKRVKPTEYRKRLLQVFGEKRKIIVKEIQMKKGNITSDDVFILDLGVEIFQINGKKANKDEKFKALQYVQKMKSERLGRAKVEVIEEDDLRQAQSILRHLPEGKSEEQQSQGKNKKGMFRVSDASGQLRITNVAEDKLDISLLDSGDVFLVDSGDQLIVWLGKDSSIEERGNAMSYAHSYLKDKQNPFCPVTCLGEKQAEKSKEFLDLFDK